MQTNHWLPLTEYALRSGMSISTLRRKIKSNNIEYKMEEGRYLIRLDQEQEPPVSGGFASNDTSRLPVARPELSVAPPKPALPDEGAVRALRSELDTVRAEMKQSGEEGSLRWRALEARVAGIAKKLDFFGEQMAELKMLVKIFEERLDGRL